MGPKTSKAFRVLLPRFSLRTGLALLLFTTLCFGFVGRWIHDVRQRGEAQLRFVARCASEPKRSISFGSSMYEQETSVDGFTAFIRHRVHPEYQRRFRYIHVSGALLEKEPRIELKRFFGVQHLELVSTSNRKTLLEAMQTPGLTDLAVFFRNRAVVGPDVEWGQVAKAQSLKSLEIELLGESDALLVELGKLPKLEKVRMEGCTPEGLIGLAKSPSLLDLSVSLHLPGGYRKEPRSEEELKGIRRSLKLALDELGMRPKLTKLSINGFFPLTPDDMRGFCSNSKLQELHLKHFQITPGCLAEFVRLPNLAWIEIDDKLLRDEHLELFSGMKQLKLLTVGPEISGEAIVVLREKMPQCEIWRK